MQYFFHELFITKVKKLLKKKSYKDCELAIIESVFCLSFEEIKATCSALRLNPSATNPIAKLRINFDKGKSSSYRLYAYLVVKDENFYFAYIYPKTGAEGQNSLTKEEEMNIIKEILTNIKEGKVIEVFLDKEKNKICYVADLLMVF